MKPFCFLAVVLLLSSCGLNTENSVSGDAELYGETPTSQTQASSGFLTAQLVIKSRCVRCHRAFGKYSETEWINGVYLAPGAPENSLLYSRLIGAGAGGKENMPPDGPLQSDEMKSIFDWIKSTGQIQDSNRRRSPS